MASSGKWKNISIPCCFPGPSYQSAHIVFWQRGGRGRLSSMAGLHPPSVCIMGDNSSSASMHGSSNGGGRWLGGGAVRKEIDVLLRGKLDDATHDGKNRPRRE